MDALRDLATSLVASPAPGSSGLTLAVATGDGAVAFSHAPPYDVLVAPDGVVPTWGNAELMRVASRSGDVLTIVPGTRGLHGTTPQAVAVGWRVFAPLTAELVAGMQAAIDANTTAAATNASAIASEATARASADTTLTTGLAGKVGTGDSRLSDARTPTAHKASHATGGSDALAPADIGLGTLDTDGTLAANSDARIASQKAVKTYVDAHAGGAAMHALPLGNLTGAVTVPLASYPLTVAQGALTGNATIGFSGQINGAKADFVIDQPASGSPCPVTVTDGTTPTVVVSSSVNPSAFVAGTRMHFQVIVQPDGSLWVTTVETAPTPIPPSAPVNTVAPTVSGATPVGSVLTCSPGSWTGSPAPTFAYQWTSAGTNISGATASTYTTVSGDATHAIGCQVVGTNASGSSAAVASSNTITPASGPVDPLTLSPAIWIDPSSDGLTDGALVSTAADRATGTAFNLTAAGTARPVFKANQLNTQPVHRFDGSTSMLSGAIGTGYDPSAAAFTMVAVLKPTDFANVAATIWGPTGSTQAWASHIDGSGHVDLERQSTTLIGAATTALTAGAAAVVLYTYDDSTGAWAFYVNGAAAGSGTTSASPTTGGGLLNGGMPFGDAYHFKGDMGARGIFNRVLSTADRNTLTHSLGTKYGITVV